jgi:hypothetical protein
VTTSVIFLICLSYRFYYHIFIYGRYHCLEYILYRRFSPVAYVSSSFCFSLLTRDTVLIFRLVQYGGCWLPLLTTNFLAFASGVNICFLPGQLSLKPPVSSGCLWKRTVLSGRLLLAQRYGCLYWLHLIVNICTMNGIQLMYLMVFLNQKKLAIEVFCLQCELNIF